MPNGTKNKDGYRSFLPSMMDFPLNNALIEGSKKTKKDWGKGMLKVYQCLSDDYLYADANKLVTFCDNHDMNRIYTQLAEDKELLKMGLALVFTTRGIPQLFYGTELAFYLAFGTQTMASSEPICRVAGKVINRMYLKMKTLHRYNQKCGLL
ncbi:MAG: hypothetical protein IPO04_15675 [Cytophagaceae bacterium]|nr:hypothetical protein [Cytophagaceae bacterium]